MVANLGKSRDIAVRFGIAGVGLLLALAAAIPGFADRARSGACESAAVATLRNLCAAQREFCHCHWVDGDGDGRGEPGFFGELTAATPVRAPANGAGARVVDVPLLPPSFAEVEGGRVHRGGYWFQIWLPARGSRWVGDAASAGEVDAAAAPSGWRAYAWPDDQREHGRAFVIDASGIVRACANAGLHYCGSERPVSAEAAGPTGAAVRGRDGNDWVVVQ
ncbi:MAG TPA: hypothetical protein VK348_05085 [Planctomycetota bacterium]|nr:hypothetical protein [Planctomycetota bacterium]